MTTRDVVGQVALRRFAAHGFDETTLDEIAAEVGVGRRTLFSYFPSKNDMVWGDFDGVIDRLETMLAATDPGVPLTTALSEAVIESNTYPAEELPDLRLRMALIFSTPTLQAHSMLRYADWRAAVAQFAAHRLGCAASDFVPTALGHAALAASMVAFGHWIDHPEEDLLRLLRASYGLLADGFERRTT